MPLRSSSRTSDASLKRGRGFVSLRRPSGAEAAVTLAERVAGSEEAFAGLMNQKAAELTRERVLELQKKYL